MKRNLVFGLITTLYLVSCSDNNTQSANTSADTASSEQSNAAMSPAGDTSASSTTTGSTASGNTTFKGVMDKMMQDMHSMQMSNDPDHDFAMMMRRHHEGAIEMANIEVAKGTSAELKQVAQKIITDAQKDISELTTFLNSHQPAKQSDFAKNQMDKMMKSMNMDMSESGNTDKDFAMMMSMHHQHGIDMARDYLKVGTAAETKAVANRTIKTNGEDIKKLKPHMGASADHSGHDMSQMKKAETNKAASKKTTETTDHSQHQQ